MPCTHDLARESSGGVNMWKTRVNARNSQGTVVIVIECKDSVIIINEYCLLTLYSIIMCIYLCFNSHIFFFAR